MSSDPFATVRVTLAEYGARCMTRVGHHRPLHLRARLVRPLALNDGMLFDGLLRVAVAKEYLRCPQLAGMPLLTSVTVPLPLSHRVVGKTSYPLATMAYADPGARLVLRPGHPDLLEYAVTWHKTWEHSGDDYLVFQNESGKSLRGKLSLASAAYKGWSMTLNVVAWRECHFWAHGDAEEIERLLAQLPAIGKKQSYGYGLVAPGGWSVEEVGEGRDWSEYGPDGAPTRPIPVNGCVAQPPRSALRHCAYRSPAYDAQQWVDCWVPE